MAADNSSYDYFLQNNPHRQEHSRQNYHQNDRYSELESPESYNVYSVAPKRFSYDREAAALPAPQITMKKTPPKRGSVVKVALIALSGLLMISTVLYGKVQTNRMYRHISNENSAFELAQSENLRLKSELEGKMTLKNVEEYAEKVLGLRKLDNSQIKYVQTQTDDTVEILEENKSLPEKIKEKLSGFVEYIFG